MKMIAPSILSSNFAELSVEIKAVDEAGADMIHVDVMDGHFVPNLTFGPPVIGAVRNVTTLPFDVHLMIENPERHVEKYIDAGADIVTVHAEAEPHLHRTIQKIKGRGAKAGVSLNPGSPLCLVEELLEHIDLLLIMSVNPGYGGQSFIDSSLSKIERAKNLIERRGLPVLIEVDGGVKSENIKRISDAGTDVFVAGSAVFNSGDYGSTIREMKNLIS